MQTPCFNKSICHRCVAGCCATVQMIATGEVGKDAEDVGVQLFQPPSREKLEKPAYMIHTPSLVNVDGDGSCLYHCLHRLYQRDISNVDLNFIFRRMEETYDKHPELYPNVNIQTIRHAWGGERELELAAAAFTVIIHAFQQPDMNGPAYRTSVSYPNQTAVTEPKQYMAWGVVLTKLSATSPTLNHWQYLNTLKNTSQVVQTPGCNPHNKPPSPVKLVRRNSSNSKTLMDAQLHEYRERHRRSNEFDDGKSTDQPGHNEQKMTTEMERMNDLMKIFKEQDDQEYADRRLALMLS